MSKYGITNAYEPNQFRTSKVTNLVDPRRKTRSGLYAASSYVWSGELTMYGVKSPPAKRSIEWNPADGFDTNDRFLLKNRAVAGMRSQLDSFRDIAESLAEGKETLSYLTKRVEGALRMVRNIRKNPVAFAMKRARIIKHKLVNRKRVTSAEYMFYNKLVKKQKGKSWRERAKTIPDGWLEYHFAIVPILGASNAVHEFFASPPMPRLKSHATSTKSRNFTKSTGVTSVTESVTAKNSITMGCTLTAYNPNVALLKRVGITSPLAVAWAVVPLSWVFDYFVNVGQVIDNLANPYHGVRIRDSYTSSTTYIAGSRAYSTPEFMAHYLPGKPARQRGVDYGGLDGTHNSTIRRTSRSLQIDLTYNFVRNPSPINVQRLSYLLSVGVNLMKGK